LEDAVTIFGLKEYLLCVQRLQPLTQEELDRSFDAWMRGDERARRLIEERNLYCVVAWVQPYRGQGSSLECLIEAGNRALLRALRRQPGLKASNLEDHLRNAVEEAVESLLLAHRH
jgi:DNA-directed RNA polymerase sigma subunit (sigma70/sigma32)